MRSGLRRVWVPALLLALLGVGWRVLAPAAAVSGTALLAAAPDQDPAPQAPPPAPPVDPQSGQPVFRTGINFVRVDVIATDRQGNPVVDLTQDDFELTEDNKPQTVETFRLIKVDPAAPVNTQRSITTRQDEEAASADENARIFVFFLDDYHVRLGSSLAVRKPLIEFIQTQLSPNDLVAVMYPLTPIDAAVLTRNHAGVIRTIEQFQGRKYNYDPRNGLEQNYIFKLSVEEVERIRREVSLSALKGMSVKLGAMREGRKSIIFVSEGFTGLLPPQMRGQVAGFGTMGNPAAQNPLAGDSSNIAEDRARFSVDQDVQRDLQNVFEAANRTNTSIYAVDPRGLSTGEFDIADNVGMRQSSAALSDSLNSLRTLAENTDGRAIVNRNDLAKGMQQIVRDSSAYYLLGYNSTQAPTDGKFHAIKVRVTRPGVDVRARKGYWALSAVETARATAPPKPGPPPAVTRAIASIAPTSGRRLVRTWLGSAPGEGGLTRVTFVWEPVAAAPGVRRDDPQRVVLVASSASGDVYFNGKVAPADEGGAGKGAAVSFDVKPGKVQLRMEVEGTGAEALDTEEREITIADLTSPDLKLATPRVFVARNGREWQQLQADPAAVPTALRDFRRTDRLLVRVGASGAAAAPVALTARLLNRQGQKMADLAVKPAAADERLPAIDLPLSSLAVGEYLLELAASSEGQKPAIDLVAFRVQS